MNTTKHDPNTTILLPGGCDAKCGFCFWNREGASIRPPQDYLMRVSDLWDALPPQFRCLSVSGGEPTISPWFGRFLAMLGAYRRRRNRWDRVVLTTHGGRLAGALEAVGNAVDHINISRHAIGTDENRAVFQSPVLSDDDMAELIARVHSETACDVTLNCVVAPDVTVEFCEQFLRYADGLHADAVSFRRIAGSVDPTDAERAFVSRYGVVAESRCPVCRGLEQDVDGFRVSWKGSVAEPSLTLGECYEVVIHPDGRAYADWGSTMPLYFTTNTYLHAEHTTVRRGQSVVGCGMHRDAGGC